MIDGLTLTLVGMLFVGAFLAVLVLAMVLLRYLAGRVASAEAPTGEAVAAIAAAVRARRSQLFELSPSSKNGRK